MSLVTRLVSRMLVYSGYAAKCISARQRGADPSLTILAYHRIGTPQSDHGELDSKIISASPSGFDWQMAYLKNHFTVLSFEELIESKRQGRRLPTNAAIITFDDGYRDNYDLAYPILQNHHLPATIFLITGLIGTTQVMWWDEVARLVQKTNKTSVDIGGLGFLKLNTPQERLQAREKLRSYLKKLPGDQLPFILNVLRQQMGSGAEPSLDGRAFLNWDEIKEMQQHDISFGAHTLSHPILTRIPLEQAEYEIGQSKKAIEDFTGKPALTFAYPNGRQGDFNHQTRAIIARLRFEIAVTLMHGSNSLDHSQNVDWLSLRRVYIGGNDDRAVFIAKTSGALEKLNQIRFIGKQNGDGG